MTKLCKRDAANMITSLVTLLATVHPVCALIFGCACSVIWAGGSSTCTHAPWNEGTQPYCPWCEMGSGEIILLGAGMILAVGIFVHIFGSQLSRFGQFFVGVLATVLVLCLTGALTALLTDYPYGALAHFIPSLCHGL